MTALAILTDLEPRRSVVALRDPIFTADTRQEMWDAADQMEQLSGRVTAEFGVFIAARINRIGAV